MIFLRFCPIIFFISRRFRRFCAMAGTRPVFYSAWLNAQAPVVPASQRLEIR